MKDKHIVQFTTWIAFLASLITVIPVVRLGYGMLETIAPVLFLMLLFECIQKSATKKLGDVFEKVKQEKKKRLTNRTFWYSLLAGLILSIIFLVIMLAGGSLFSEWILNDSGSAEALRTLKIGFFCLGFYVILEQILSVYQAMDIGSGKTQDFFRIYMIQKIVYIVLIFVIQYLVKHMEEDIVVNLWWIHFAAIFSSVFSLVFYYFRYGIPDYQGHVKNEKKFLSQVTRTYAGMLRDVFVCCSWILIDLILFCYLNAKNIEDITVVHKLFGAMFYPCVVMSLLPIVLVGLQSIDLIDSLEVAYQEHKPLRFQKNFLALFRMVLLTIVPIGFLYYFESNAIWNILFSYEDYELYANLFQYFGIASVLFSMCYIMRFMMKKMKLNAYLTAYELLALFIKVISLVILIRYFGSDAFAISWMIYFGVLLFMMIAKVNSAIGMDLTKFLIYIAKIVCAGFAMHGGIYALNYFLSYTGVNGNYMTSLVEGVAMLAVGITTYLMTINVLGLTKKRNLT